MRRSVIKLAAQEIFVPEIVTVDAGGAKLVTTRPVAERLLLAMGVLPHNFDHSITGDPNAIDTEESPLYC